MWILKFLPDFIFHLILLLGIAGLVASFVLKFIPFISQYRLPIQVVGAVLVVIGLYMAGAIANESAWQARVDELNLKIARAEAQSAEANTQLASKLAAKQREIQAVQEDARNRIRQNAAAMDSVCKVPSEVISILNDTARGVKR
jgi:signal transduction histidine kinase